MKKTICLLLISLLLTSSACAGRVKIYAPSGETEISLCKLTDDFYAGNEIPERIAVSVEDPSQKRIPFAFYPKSRTLAFLYGKNDIDEFGAVISMKGILVLLEVPYKNAREVIVQDDWRGSVIGIYRTGSIAYEEICNTIASLPWENPKNIQKACYGIYYPNCNHENPSVVHEGFQKEEYDPLTEYPYVGFFVTDQASVPVPERLKNLYNELHIDLE